MNKRKIILLSLVSFVCGLLLGVLGSYWSLGYWMKQRMAAPHHPQLIMRIIAHRLDQELDLNHEQEKQLKRILKEKISELEALRQEYDPKARRILDSALQELNEHLDEKQQADLERLYKEFQERQKHHHHPRWRKKHGKSDLPPDWGPPPPPPPGATPED